MQESVGGVAVVAVPAKIGVAVVPDHSERPRPKDQLARLSRGAHLERQAYPASRTLASTAAAATSIAAAAAVRASVRASDHLTIPQP